MDGRNNLDKADSAIKLISSGNTELDFILGGGFPQDHIYLIQGQPGVGKTTLALQFLLAGRDAGEKTLYITLSESADDLRATSIAHGWSIDGIEIYEHWSTAAANTESFHTIFHPDEVDLSETINDFLNIVERLQPHRIVFDSLSELKLLASDDLRYRRQIIALRDKFSSQKSTVLLLDDQSIGDNDLQIQSVVHGVISLTQAPQEYGPDRRRLRIVKLRGTLYASGYHDFKIKKGGLNIYPRLVAAEHQSDFTEGKTSSEVSELDDMLGGGLDWGTTTLLLGPSGTGKSTIAMQFALSTARAGRKVAFYSFDERLMTIFKRTDNLGLNLQGVVDSNLMKVTSIDPAEYTPGEFANLVLTAVQVDGVQMVIIDSLSGYVHSMPDAKFLFLQLHELLTYLGQQGVTTLISVTQHGLFTSPDTSEVDVSYLSDNIILFKYFEQMGEVRIAMSIFKRRSGGHERSIRELSMNNEKGISVGGPLVNVHGVLSGSAIYTRND